MKDRPDLFDKVKHLTLSCTLSLLQPVSGPALILLYNYNMFYVYILKSDKEKLYYKYDVHLTPLGHRYAAEVILKQLKNERLINN